MAGVFSLACLGGQVTEWTLPHLKKGFECVIGTTKRHIGYMTHYDDSINDLREKEPTTSWVQAEADKANNKGADINHSEVKKWSKREKPLIEEAKRVISEFERLDETNKFTFCRFMPNLRRRYCVGRKARKCIEGIEEFRKRELGDVIVEEIPLGEITDDSWLNRVNLNACELQSRATVMNEILRLLEDDSIQRIGVYGPEGGGKTLLMEQVLNQVIKRKLLNHQVRVQVPKEGDNEKQIQTQIAEKFCPSVLAEAEDINVRAEHLKTWFNGNTEKKAVIILDGLSRKIDLGKIGIPSNEEKVCNVILTARDMDLLVNDMGLSKKRIFSVEPLSLEESRKLFLYIVRRSGETIDVEKKSVAGELVKYCGGLPSLIIHQASILTNHRHISAWHDALREIKSRNAKKMLDPVRRNLSSCSSDEHEQQEIRSLFSLCGLFGESSILVGDLTVHCWALGMFPQSVSVKDTKNRVKRLLHILRARSLVGGNNNEVNIADLFREVAVRIAAEQNQLVTRNGGIHMRSGFKNWTDEKIKRCTVLSIDGLDIFYDHPESAYDKLKMLQLGSKQQFLEINHDNFFNLLKELRGLHLKQVGFTSSSFPSTVKNLGNLQTLCLDGCRLKDVGNIRHLKKLQILRISGSDIIELPTEVRDLTDLRLLDLRGCRKLHGIEHGLLGGLKRLEELYLDDCFDKWEEPHYWSRSSRRNATLDELNEMTWLSTLHLYVPRSTMLPQNLKLEKLERYKILLGDVRNYSKEDVTVRTLRLDLSDSTSILWDDGVKRIMHKTKSLYLKGMMRMPKPSIHQLCSQGFPYLKDLHLQNCDSVEYIVESSELVLAFPYLETLTLVNLKNLRKIRNGQLMDESFGQLKGIIVQECHVLENLFDLSFAERILAIEKIEVKNCKKIKEIVTYDTGHDQGTRKKITWDKLHHLSLENLEQLVGLCITDTTQTQSLESISQGSMSELPAFFDGEQISFPGLKSLSLIELPKVRKIWHRNIPPSELSNLRLLTLKGFKDASQLEDILFYSPHTTPQQEPAHRKPILGFFCLKAQVDHSSLLQSPQGLMTSKMEKKNEKKHIALEIETLYPDGHLQGNSGLQNLQSLIVSGCETLEFLFTASMAQELPHLTELTISGCKKMKEVIQVKKEDNGLKSIKFQELTMLCLGSLENLATFCQGNISISFPSLKIFKIFECHKLATLFTDSKHDETKEEISGSLFHAKVTASFPSLEELVIYNMNNLIKIWQCQAYGHAISSQHGGESSGSSSKFPGSKLWNAFLNIKRLHITYCHSLVKILDVEGSLDADMFDNDKRLDAQLNEVYLEHLTKIEHIWGRSDPRGKKIGYRCLRKVSVCKCQMIESLFPASMTKDLIELQRLEVKLCDRMEHLIGKENSSGGNNSPNFFFPDVKILELRELPKLKRFYHEPHCSEWPSLEQLMISECNNFKIFGFEYKKSIASSQASQHSQTLFSVNKDSFCRLSTLELSQNGLMKEIWRGLYPMELFRNLKVLKLIGSSKEPIILPVKFLSKSPYLESLQVHNQRFPMLKTPEHNDQVLRPFQELVTERPLREMELNMIPEMADLKEALDSLLGASSYSFGCLTSLKVANCHRLEYLLTYSTVKSLRCLTRLTIANCESMKVVVASEEGKTEGEVILEKLECLTLDSLKGLTSFCEENYKFRFPSMEEVTVRECRKMVSFTHGETCFPNLTKMELKQRKINVDDERILNKIIFENMA